MNIKRMTGNGVANNRRVSDAYEYIQPEDIDNVLRVSPYDSLVDFANYSGMHYVPLLQKLYDNVQGKDQRVLSFLINDLETLNDSIVGFWYK